MDDRANLSELLINVVRTNKPKTLTGLNQQVCGWAQRLPPSAAVVHTATGEQAEPTSSVGISVERGKPVAFPEFRESTP